MNNKIGDIFDKALKELGLPSVFIGEISDTLKDLLKEKFPECRMLKSTKKFLPDFDGSTATFYFIEIYPMEEYGIFVYRETDNLTLMAYFNNYLEKQAIGISLTPSMRMVVEDYYKNGGNIPPLLGF